MRLTTRARWDPCPTCHAWTIRALDSDTAGIDTRLDPQPLTPYDEALTILTGRWTYEIFPTAGRFEIAHRDQWRITGNHGNPVFPKHQCPGVIPPGPLPKPRKKRKARNNERPPF